MAVEPTRQLVFMPDAHRIQVCARALVPAETCTLGQATLGQHPLSSFLGYNGPPQVLNFNFQQTGVLELPGEVTSLLCTEKFLVVGCYGTVAGKTATPVGLIVLVDLGSGTLTPWLNSTQRYSHKAKITALASGAVGGRLVLFSGADDGSLHAWPIGDPAASCIVLEGHTAAVRGLEYVADRLYSVSADHTMCIWNPAASQLPVQLLLPAQHTHGDTALNCVASIASGAGNHLLTGGDNGTIRVCAGERCC